VRSEANAPPLAVSPDHAAYKECFDKGTKAQAKKEKEWFRFCQLSQGVLAELHRMVGRNYLEKVLLCMLVWFVSIHLSLVLGLCWQDPCVVIDPFAGTGSTGASAFHSGSYYFGVDTDEAARVHASLSLCM
jgi:hypothetical protein